VEKVAVRLTPQQAVRLWLAEAHQYPSLVAYSESLTEAPESTYPQNALPRRVSEAVRQSLRGMTPSRIDELVLHAAQDTYFLYYLVHGLTCTVLERQEQLALKTLLASHLLQDLLRPLDQDRDVAWMRVVLSQQLPFPLDAETAAAIQAAITHRVESWTNLRDVGDLDGWVLDSFVGEGKRLLPEGAWRVHADPDMQALLPPPPEDELRAAFADDASYQAFVAGEDFRNGLADVPDVVFDERREAVKQAIQTLIDQGELQAGRVLRLDRVPLVFLQEVPLIDGIWVDRTVLMLAEWAVLLAKRGFVLRDSDDQHAFAWHTMQHSDSEGIARTDAWALRATADAHLAGFPGRAREIDGRPYLHLEDYAGWKGRWLKGKLLAQVEDGIVAEGWNGWVAARGGEGVAVLAGVPVGPIPCYAADAVTTVHPIDAVPGKLVDRETLIRSIRACTAAGQGTALLEAAQRWREVACSLLHDLCTLAGTETTLSRRYFGGQRLLYPDSAQHLAENIGDAEYLVDLFNRLVVSRLANEEGEAPITAIDVARLRAANQRIVAVAVHRAVEFARIKALDATGDRSRAWVRLQHLLTSAPSDTSP
jgi:hypothetical protein